MQRGRQNRPFATRKAEALLAYLALAPGRAHARASLYGLLWGDREEEQARGSLRYALTDIRKGLGDHHGVLRTERDVVSLKADAVTVDAVEFERLARSDVPAALEQAVSLYKGDLLAGLQSAPQHSKSGSRWSESGSAASLSRLVSPAR